MHLPLHSAYETKMSKTDIRYWISLNHSRGAGGNRTHYMMLAKHPLYHLSYSPMYSPVYNFTVTAPKSYSQSKYCRIVVVSQALSLHSQKYVRKMYLIY